MSANLGTEEIVDPFAAEEHVLDHAPEPWRQEGRYIRDVNGAIVVRGRTAADARRIVAAVNGVRGIPTEALEGWKTDDVSDPGTRPDFEIDLAPELEPSPFAVAPPPRRSVDRRRRQRRANFAVANPEQLVFDRRVFERRRSDRRQ